MLAQLDQLVDEFWAVITVEFDAVSDVRDKAMTRVTSTAFTTGIIDEKIFDIIHFIISFLYGLIILGEKPSAPCGAERAGERD